MERSWIHLIPFYKSSIFCARVKRSTWFKRTLPNWHDPKIGVLPNTCNQWQKSKQDSWFQQAFLNFHMLHNMIFTCFIQVLATWFQHFCLHFNILYSAKKKGMSESKYCSNKAVEMRVHISTGFKVVLGISLSSLRTCSSPINQTHYFEPASVLYSSGN